MQGVLCFPVVLCYTDKKWIRLFLSGGCGLAAGAVQNVAGMSRVMFSFPKTISMFFPKEWE
jgi:hypothetical protein